jgi:hypothetical protein
MSEAPKPSAADVWITRIIVLVVAAMCLAFGLPLAVSGFDGLIATLGSGTMPTLWLVGSFLLGLILCVIAAGTAWRAFVPAPRRDKSDG